MYYSHAQGDVTCDGETTLRDVSTLIYVVLNLAASACAREMDSFISFCAQFSVSLQAV